MIESLLIAIAVVGVLLVLFLLSQVRKVNEDLRLKKHQSTEAGLADLLNYAAVVDDGVIVGKNGSFMAAWLYKGSDNASATDVAGNELVPHQPSAGQHGQWLDGSRRCSP